MPGHGAQIFARAPTKSSVQTCLVPEAENREQAPSLNRTLNVNLIKQQYCKEKLYISHP